MNPDEAQIRAVAITEGKRAFFRAHPEILDAVRRSATPFALTIHLDVKKHGAALHQIGMLNKARGMSASANPGLWYVGQAVLREMAQEKGG